MRVKITVREGRGGGKGDSQALSKGSKLLQLNYTPCLLTHNTLQCLKRSLFSVQFKTYLLIWGKMKSPSFLNYWIAWEFNGFQTNLFIRLSQVGQFCGMTVHCVTKRLLQNTLSLTYSAQMKCMLRNLQNTTWLGMAKTIYESIRSRCTWWKSVASSIIL